VVAACNFPRYSEAEIRADSALHLVALAMAIAAVSWRFVAAILAGRIEQAIANIVYGCGLIGMLTASAADRRRGGETQTCGVRVLIA
jgi:predicted membrane channel-forming protein YqfA (hemolysin III family)